MSSLNTVALTGRLVSDIEMKTTPKGINVVSNTIAVNAYNGDTSFVDLVLFGKTAEVASKYVNKGQQIGVTGRIKQESWEDKTTGQKRSKLVVVVENLQLPPKGDKQDGASVDIPDEAISLKDLPF